MTWLKRIPLSRPELLRCQDLIKRNRLNRFREERYSLYTTILAATFCTLLERPRPTIWEGVDFMPDKAQTDGVTST